MSLDVEKFENIPGYKAILKAVLKAQVQLLLDQLSEHAGEESFILMACSGDGVLSQLGSSTGKGFVDGREEIKSQFLGYCLKSQHKKSTESRASPYQRPEASSAHKRMGPASKTLNKRQKVATSTPALASYGQDGSQSMDNSHTSDSCAGDDDSKSHDADLTTKTAFPPSLNLNHTQTSAEGSDKTKSSDKSEYIENESTASIKIEPISDNADSGQEAVGAETTSDLPTSDQWASHMYSTAGNTDSAALDSGAYNAKEEIEKQEVSTTSWNLNATPPTNENTGQVVQQVESSSANQNPSLSDYLDAGTNENTALTSSFCTTSSSPEVHEAACENSTGQNVADQSDLITVEITPGQNSVSSNQKADSPVDQIDLTADDDDENDHVGENNDANNHLVVEINSSDKDLGYLSSLINQPSNPACNFSIVNVSSLSTQESFAYADSNAPGPSSARDDNGCDASGIVYLHNHNAAVMSHYNTINDTGTLYIRPVDHSGASFSGTWMQASTSMTQTTNQISPGFNSASDGEITIQETYADPTQHLPDSIPINPYQAVKFNKDYYGRSKDRILLKKHICEICGKRCLKKSDLERHLTVHTGDRPFRCGVCGQSYSQRSNLLQHKQRYRH